MKYAKTTFAIHTCLLARWVDVYFGLKLQVAKERSFT